MARIRRVRFFLENSQLLFVGLRALHECLRSTAAFQLRTVSVVRIGFAAAARYLRMPIALGFGGVIEMLLRLFRMLAVFVRGAWPADAFRIRMFVRHG